MAASDDLEPGGAWQEGALGGTVLRGKDGSLYFIRDEMLNAFRVAGEGRELLERAISSGDQEVQSVEPPQKATLFPVAQTGYVRGSLLRRDPRNQAVKVPNTTNLAASTVMCPWFCGHTPTGPACW
jgi:hypothetical protein